jgi:hypothetical protein
MGALQDFTVKSAHRQLLLECLLQYHCSLSYDIVQDLKLRDLLTLCESFRGTAHAHVEVVSRQRAEELLYSIFTTSQVKAQFYIWSTVLYME